VTRALGVVLLIALALTACGGGGKSPTDKYKEEFPKIDRQLAVLSVQVGSGLRGAGKSADQALAGKFAGYASQLGALRTRLAGLEPPGQLKSDQAGVLAAMAAVRGELADIAAAAKVGDAAAAGNAATRLVRDGARLDEARSALARAARKL
jgi:hypothetical protein